MCSYFVPLLGKKGKKKLGKPKVFPSQTRTFQHRQKHRAISSDSMLPFILLGQMAAKTSNRDNYLTIKGLCFSIGVTTRKPVLCKYITLYYFCYLICILNSFVIQLYRDGGGWRRSMGPTGNGLGSQTYFPHQPSDTS